MDSLGIDCPADLQDRRVGRFGAASGILCARYDPLETPNTVVRQQTRIDSHELRRSQPHAWIRWHSAVRSSNRTPSSDGTARLSPVQEKERVNGATKSRTKGTWRGRSTQRNDRTSPVVSNASIASRNADNHPHPPATVRPRLADAPRYPRQGLGLSGRGLGKQCDGRPRGAGTEIPQPNDSACGDAGDEITVDAQRNVHDLVLALEGTYESNHQKSAARGPACREPMQPRHLSH